MIIFYILNDDTCTVYWELNYKIKYRVFETMTLYIMN